MNKRTIIRFSAGVNKNSANTLMNTVENLINSGVKEILLLISSPGGDVLSGISIYNFLKGAPIKVDTCNFGSVDSIASVIYCAGENRYSVSNARFLIHGITFGVSANSGFEEKKLEEIIGGLKVDRENMAKIIADNCQKSQDEIQKMMFKGVTHNPEEAKKMGLTTEIRDNLFSAGEKIIGIG